LSFLKSTLSAARAGKANASTAMAGIRRRIMQCPPVQEVKATGGFYAFLGRGESQESPFTDISRLCPAPRITGWIRGGRRSWVNLRMDEQPDAQSSSPAAALAAGLLKLTHHPGVPKVLTGLWSRLYNP